MFTGLVQAVGTVLSREATPTGATLLIDPGRWSHRPSRGESVAVNGCCLTVAEPGPPIAFDVVHETLRKTTIDRLEPADEVNLEHAATPATLLGGHIVHGHVDGVGVAARVREGAAPGEWRLRIEPPDDLLPFLVPQGCVSIDGVSLTVAGVSDRSFEVALIPTTLELSNLGRIDAPTPVNLETDCLVKAVVNYLRQRVDR